MRTPYPYYRYPEDLDIERREKALATFIRSLAALGIFFVGVWVALLVTP